MGCCSAQPVEGEISQMRSGTSRNLTDSAVAGNVPEHASAGIRPIPPIVFAPDQQLDPLELFIQAEYPKLFPLLPSESDHSYEAVDSECTQYYCSDVT
jgi:hypothetical protein